jgi:hypothetical protein
MNDTNFDAWTQANLAAFAKDAYDRWKERGKTIELQEQAIEQLRGDLREAMRLLRESQNART